MQIIELKDNNEIVYQLTISADTAEEAKEGADTWCEEHNCIMLEFIGADGTMFIARVCSDDYD